MLGVTKVGGLNFPSKILGTTRRAFSGETQLGCVLSEMVMVPVSSPSLGAKVPPWQSSWPSDLRSSFPSLQEESLKFVEAVKKGLLRRNPRYVTVSEDERSRLAASFLDKVIIDKEKILVNKKVWENSLIGKFLGFKILISFLKEKVLHKWPLAGKVQIIDLTEG